MTALVLRSVDGLRTGARSVLSVWGFIVAIPLAVALLDRSNVTDILRIAAEAFAGTLPYIAGAVLLIAWLKAAGATALVSRAFEGRETRMIVLAAVLGGLAPFCSCEVIPLIAGLLAVGVPLSAIMAFWLSSPLIDPSSMLITAAALGWDFRGRQGGGRSRARPDRRLRGPLPRVARRLRTSRSARARAAAVAPAGSKTARRCGASGASRRGGRHSAPKRSRTRRFLVKWLALAYLIEGLLVTYVPADTIAGVVGGDGLAPIAMGALVGAPAYLNGYAAPALVAGLMEQGMGAGAAMSFMVAGSVSCIPAMVAVWSIVRRQVFAAYVCFGIAGAILSGVVFAAFVS